LYASRRLAFSPMARLETKLNKYTIMKQYSILLILLVLFSCSKTNNKIEEEFPGVDFDESERNTVYGGIEELPENLANVQKLKLTNWEIDGIKEIPSIISELTNLQYLDLSGNNISDLSKIKCLTNLQYLFFNGNKLSNLEKIENLTNLISLELRGNNLSNLKGIERLANLRHLDVSGNNLSELKGIEMLTKLEFLSIGHNNFKSFPPEILDLKSLKKFKLDWSNINTFPDSFYAENSPIEELDMAGMSDFDFKSNLPKMHKLKRLKKLCLAHNQISLQNIDFEQFGNLEVLDYACQDRLNIIPALKKIAKSPKLKELNLYSNNIKYIPKEIALFDSLEALYLFNNKVKKLPLEITKLTKLKMVFLRQNPIDTLAIKKIERIMANTDFIYDK
jgi:Leucine-rich repeat (LRR) protein